MTEKKTTPCTGCGFCCAAYPGDCAIARKEHPGMMPCPELHFAEGRHWCGWLMKVELGAPSSTDPSHLHIGEGCSFSKNSWLKKEITDHTVAREEEESSNPLLELIKALAHATGSTHISIIR